MKHLIRILPLVAAMAMAGLPLRAQEDPPADGKIDEGMTLMQEGAQLLLRGFLDEVEPRLEDLGSRAEELAQDLEPALRMLTEEMAAIVADIASRIDDISNYEAPVFLDNGDIIIRRKPDAPPYVAPDPDAPAQGEVEL
jgi:hypothetical protein